MYERTLLIAERLLALRPATAVPVQELWESVCKEATPAWREQCTLSDFAALLDADPRFEFIPEGERDDEEEGELEVDDQLLQLGFRPDSPVRLKRSKAATMDAGGEDIASLHLRHLSETGTTPPAKRQPVRSTSPRGRSGVRRRAVKRGPRRKR